ncbi:MAG: hypothetical protein L0H79_07015 [Intrasporangium sp.]|uniref:hypothetical protein n=1 Tax=Intrasporangium sp. TaxID=1925024 RepID=UPI002648D209|nr:hypothetical protein [Intrasporangium sp.]MDN5795489.1 hypothetical protein [Intrasporangium sp.]
MSSPVPREVADELTRVVERWHQLPLDHALSRMPLVADLVQRLADDVADSRSRAAMPVPDLGPAVLMDQLTVLVHDHSAAFPPASRNGHATRTALATRPGTPVTDLASELSDIRKGLALGI